MTGVMGALPQLSGSALLTQWSLDPIAVATALLSIGWYLRSVRRFNAGGRRWPTHYSVAFVSGTALFLWICVGCAQVYAQALFWVWTAQVLSLLLVVPIVVIAGRPVELARQVGPNGAVSRAVRSAVGRSLTSPFVAPALAPLLFAALFFTPLAGTAVSHPWVGWVAHLTLFTVGLAIALPLVDLDTGLSSLAVGLSLATGVVELLIDAIPGIALRLSTKPVGTYFQHRELYAWSPAPLRDQQAGGAILWCVAELLDLPFLVLVFRRWVGADEAEAARIDAVLNIEEPDFDDGSETSAETEKRGPVDAPWWLDDPRLRDRYRS